MTDSVIEENVDFYQEMLNNKKEFLKGDFEIISGIYNLLSPNSPLPFNVKNTSFLCLSQYLQYCKAKVFGDEEIAEKILKIKDSKENIIGIDGEIKGEKPTAAALFHYGEITTRELLFDRENQNSWKETQNHIINLGQLVKNFDPKIWDHYKEKFFKRGLIESMNSNKAALIELYKTKDKIIVLSGNSGKWSVGLDKDDENLLNPEKWENENIAGKILTNYREEYIRKLKKENRMNPIEEEKHKKRMKHW